MSMDKFLFFDIKRSKVINILIIIELAIWIFYSGSLISLARFNDSFKNRLYNSFSPDNSSIIIFVDLIRKNPLPEDQESNQKVVKETLDFIKSLDLSYGLFREGDESQISVDELGMELDDIKPGYNDMEKFTTGLKPMYMSWHMLNYYNEHIYGNIEIWNDSNNGEIPVILGDTFRSKYKLGDIISSSDKSYKITGFFDKDIISFDYNNIMVTSYSLNGSMIIPVEDEKIISEYNAEPVLVYSKDGSKLDNVELRMNIKEICPDAKITPMTTTIDNYLEQITKEKQFELIRVLLVTLVITASVIVTILYKISLNKDRIGVLFSIGISKIQIFKVLASEMLFVSAIGIILGDIIYLIKCKNAHEVFINENYLSNLYISICLLIVIILSSLIVGYKAINKLTPREMMGGFVE
ncbi:FtsX-like permease family protein [Clostridium sp. DSM 8431]|nr:FtsX-like permease family protein [Clostridium sp. DSM 8431]